MKKLIGGITLALVLVGLSAAPAAAQLHGNAVYPAMPGTGVTVAADVALGVNDDAKLSGTAGLESPMFLGGRVTLGLPMFSVWAGAGPTGLGVDGIDSEITFGGGAGFHVLNAPMMPVTVSIQAGIGYLSETGASLLNVTGGPLVVINVPSPSVSVKPWLMPRVHLSRVSIDGLGSDSEVGFGASGGLMVTAPMGIGVHATLDWYTIGDPSVKPLHVSGGIHYKIQVPSLGM